MEIIPPEDGQAVRRLSDGTGDQSRATDGGLDDVKGDTFFGTINKGINNLLGKVDDALGLSSISEFLIGGDGFGTRKCWDEESTAFTACTDYSACTGFSICTGYCTDSTSCIDDGDDYEYDGSSTDTDDTRYNTSLNRTPNEPSKRDLAGIPQSFTLPNKVRFEDQVGQKMASSNRSLDYTPFTREQFKEHCASGKRPLRFVGIRPSIDLVQYVIVPVTVDLLGPLGIVIGDNSDGFARVRRILPSAMAACKKLHPGDVLGRPSTADFPTDTTRLAKIPGIEIAFKDTNSSASDPCSASQRSIAPPPNPREVNSGANLVDTSPNNKSVEGMSPPDEEINIKDSPPAVSKIPTSATKDDAESESSIPLIEPIAKTRAPSAVLPSRSATSEDIAKIEDLPTKSNKAQPLRNTRDNPTCHIVKSHVVPLDSNQPSIEEEYFKNIAANNTNGSVDGMNLLGMLPCLETPTIAPLFGMLPSSTEPGAGGSADAGQKFNAKGNVLPKNADGEFSGLHVGDLSSHCISNLQIFKDKAMSTKAMVTSLLTNQSDNEAFFHQHSYATNAIDWSSIPVEIASGKGKKDAPFSNNSICTLHAGNNSELLVRYSVKMSKGMKKSRTHRKKKKDFSRGHRA